MWRRKKYCEMTVWLLLKLIQKQPPEAFCTKPVLSKTLQYLQDEQVLKSLFYSGYCDIFKIPILKNICEPLLLKMCSWNWKKCKNLASLAKWLSHRLRIKWFWVRVQLQSLKHFYIKKRFFNINIRNEWKCLFLFHDWFPVKFVFT